MAGSCHVRPLQPSLGLERRAALTKKQYEHDATAFYLSLLILLGLVGSYVPQHYRIITSRSSEGFSPWFLLLGATSSASSLVNVVTLQWGVVRCCPALDAATCFESLLGILQVFFQWLCFNIVLVLFIIYFPRHKKYVLAVPVDVVSAVDPSSASDGEFDVSGSLADSVTGRTSFNPITRASSRFLARFFTSSSSPLHHQSHPQSGGNKRRASTDSSGDSSTSSFDPAGVLPPSATRSAPLVPSHDYSLSLVLAFVVLVHLVVSIAITFGLLLALPKPTSHEPLPSSHPLPVGGVGTLESNTERLSLVVLRLWASFNGLLSTLLALSQYIPQLVHTFRTRLVGSLSVPMMMVQTPGSFVFVYSLAVRPGVEWSTWLVYLVTGILQGGLLVMCVLWKARQAAAGIDDWGHLKPVPSSDDEAAGSSVGRRRLGAGEGGRGGARVGAGGEEGTMGVTRRIPAIGEASAAGVAARAGRDEDDGDGGEAATAGERQPLLARR